MNTSQVILRIEALTRSLLEQLDRHEIPQHQNSSWANWNQCRSFTSTCLVLQYCHTLLLAGRTTTTRELYYFFCTHFRSQRECDAAIAQACRWLGATTLTTKTTSNQSQSQSSNCMEDGSDETDKDSSEPLDRHLLGLTASPKGWFCGDLQIVQSGNSTPNNDIDQDDTDTSNDQTILLDGRTLAVHQQHGSPISSDWLTVHDKHHFQVQTQHARCILVIEKEGIYQRLVQDRFFETYPCILVTGKGFPDLATRAMVSYVHQQTQLPVRGLADCNPFGVMVLHTYEGKSKTSSHNNKFGVPVEWIGLRPSQVRHLTVDNSNSHECLPVQVFQELTQLDTKRLEEHLLDETHAWTNGRGHARIDELEDMHTQKVELEALHWLGMDFCATWLDGILRANDQAVEQDKEDELEEWQKII